MRKKASWLRLFSSPLQSQDCLLYIFIGVSGKKFQSLVEEVRDIYPASRLTCASSAPPLVCYTAVHSVLSKAREKRPEDHYIFSYPPFFLLALPRCDLRVSRTQENLSHLVFLHFNGCKNYTVCFQKSD